MGARLGADLAAHPAISELRDDFDPIRSALQVRDAFPADALAEAEVAARRPPRDGRPDMTDVPFVTVGPPDSRDLDQALCIECSGAG
jgi:exoribonuclease R